MYYSSIDKEDIADGPGVRVCIFVSGCRRNCLGCQNKLAQDFRYGQLFTDDTILEIIEALKYSYIKGLTICGGEPFEQENQKDILKLIKEVRKVFSDSKDIWIYTGYELNDLLLNGQKYISSNITDTILQLANVLVTGPFILSQRDISSANPWKGSRNQQIIDSRKSLLYGRPALLLDC